MVEFEWGNIDIDLSRVTRRRYDLEPKYVSVYAEYDATIPQQRGTEARGDYLQVFERKVRAAGLTIPVWVVIVWDKSTFEGELTDGG